MLSCLCYRSYLEHVNSRPWDSIHCLLMGLTLSRQDEGHPFSTQSAPSNPRFRYRRNSTKSSFANSNQPHDIHTFGRQPVFTVLFSIHKSDEDYWWNEIQEQEKSERNPKGLVHQRYLSDGTEIRSRNRSSLQPTELSGRRGSRFEVTLIITFHLELLLSSVSVTKKRNNSLIQTFCVHLVVKNVSTNWCRNWPRSQISLHEYVQQLNYLIAHALSPIEKYCTIARSSALPLSNSVSFFHTQSRGDAHMSKKLIKYVPGYIGFRLSRQ